MDADDFLRHMRITGDIFGAPKWTRLLTEEQRAELGPDEDRVPVGVHPDGRPVTRHVVHLEDVVSAFLLALENPAAVGQTYNIAAPEAFAYDVAGGYISEQTGTPIIRVTVPDVHDFRIDISKARNELGYRPRYDTFGIIDAALDWRKRRG
jgi:nucleoside-diphosphate-sugar epimerase